MTKVLLRSPLKDPSTLTSRPPAASPASPAPAPPPAAVSPSQPHGAHLAWRPMRLEGQQNKAPCAWLKRLSKGQPGKRLLDLFRNSLLLLFCNVLRRLSSDVLLFLWPLWAPHMARRTREPSNSLGHRSKNNSKSIKDHQRAIRATEDTSVGMRRGSGTSFPSLGATKAPFSDLFWPLLDPQPTKFGLLGPEQGRKSGDLAKAMLGHPSRAFGHLTARPRV